MRDPRIYLTADEWISQQVFESHIKLNRMRFDELSEEHVSLCDFVEYVGFFLEGS